MLFCFVLFFSHSFQVLVAKSSQRRLGLNCFATAGYGRIMRRGLLTTGGTWRLNGLAAHAWSAHHCHTSVVWSCPFIELPCRVCWWSSELSLTFPIILNFFCDIWRLYFIFNVFLRALVFDTPSVYHLLCRCFKRLRLISPDRWKLHSYSMVCVE